MVSFSAGLTWMRVTLSNSVRGPREENRSSGKAVSLIRANCPYALHFFFCRTTNTGLSVLRAKSKETLPIRICSSQPFP